VNAITKSIAYDIRDQYVIGYKSSNPMAGHACRAVEVWGQGWRPPQASGANENRELQRGVRSIPVIVATPVLLRIDKNALTCTGHPELPPARPEHLGEQF
jgi:RES domain-containing protein